MKNFLATIAVCLVAAQLSSAAAPFDKVKNCTGGTFVDPFVCCKTPKLLEKAVIEKCMEQFPPPKDTAQLNKPDCMSECVMNSTGSFNYRQALIDGKVKETFVENLDDKPEWVKIVNEAVNHCLNETKLRKAEFEKDTLQLQKQYKTERICNPIAGFIMECVHVTVYTKCPPKHRSNDSSCEVVFNHLKSCPFYTLFPKKAN